jgi:hypothetical protein
MAATRQEDACRPQTPFVMHYIRRQNRSTHEERARPYIGLGLIVLVVVLLWIAIIAVAVTVYETVL